MDEIQVVFFDVGGTLVEVNGSVGEVYSRFARRYGIDRDPVVMTDAFSRSFREQPPLAFPRSTPEDGLQMLERDWWRRLVLEVIPGFPEFDEFFSEVYEFFRGREAWRLFDDVIPVLSELKNRGLRLAVISNYDSRIDDLLRDFEIGGFFDGVHISSRSGAAKPDREIFLSALRYHQVEPGKAIHVGDNLREDVEGASAVGMRAVLINRDQSHESDNGLISICRLDELTGYLKK